MTSEAMEAQRAAEAARAETAIDAQDDFTLDEALGAAIVTQTPEPTIHTEGEVVDTPDPNLDTTAFVSAKPNATQSYATSSPRTGGAPDVIAIPPATKAVIGDRLQQAPNIDMVVSENQVKWAESLKESMFHVPLDDVYQERLNEENAAFGQHVTHNNIELRGRSPTFSSKPGTQVVEGERALLQLVTHLGVGGLFRAPLWNSGLWITFKPASESELLELNRIIAADKIQAGRWSYGLALSNNVVYTLDRVFDFALAHVYNTSVRSEELSIDKLRDWIAPQDVNSFIWGFLCANYPSGFHYNTGCINNPSKCNHVFEETLNVSKLQWTDSSILTEWQRGHMASMSANSKSLDSLKRYREEMSRLQNKRVILNKGTAHEMAITIRTPTMTQYIDQGHRWIGGLVESVNSVLGLDAGDDARNLQINKLNKATTLCQYSHWIESIEYGDLTGDEKAAEERSIMLINDLASIEENLKALSATDSLREAIITEVLKYINDSTISVIGVPAYDCPVCNAPQDTEVAYPRHTSIIPLDVIQVFFALLGQRVNRIVTRSDR